MTEDQIVKIYEMQWYSDGTAVRNPPRPLPELVFRFANAIEEFAFDQAIAEIERSYKTRTAAGFSNKTYRDTVLQHIAILTRLKHTTATPLNAQPEQSDG